MSAGRIRALLAMRYVAGFKDVGGLGPLGGTQLLAEAADGRIELRDETRPLRTGGSSTHRQRTSTTRTRIGALLMPAVA
jgi:hypothetical protein